MIGHFPSNGKKSLRVMDIKITHTSFAARDRSIPCFISSLLQKMPGSEPIIFCLFKMYQGVMEACKFASFGI